MAETKIIDLKNELNKWSGQEISIRKEENGDLDVIRIALEQATFEQRETPDEYLGDHVLFLHGKAYSQEDNQNIELPSILYEIPIDGIEDIRLDSQIVTFQTSRGQYAISK